MLLVAPRSAKRRLERVARGVPTVVLGEAPLGALRRLGLKLGNHISNVRGIAFRTSPSTGPIWAVMCDAVALWVMGLVRPVHVP
ncbi:MAG: hypothetical protein GEV11_22070 [Streptosporangiales bacterium]|nr:hypothetical protein [Streptosporangiales bacterium]